MSNFQVAPRIFCRFFATVTFTQEDRKRKEEEVHFVAFVRGRRRWTEQENNSDVDKKIDLCFYAFKKNVSIYSTKFTIGD